MAVLYTDSLFCRHETGRHPESPDRIRALLEMLEESGLGEQFEAGIVEPVDLAALTQIHPLEYQQRIQQFAAAGGGRIEADTVVSLASYDIALRAAGSAISAVNDVLARGHSVAVALVRPPGHHALSTRPMGFCLFNNVSIAANFAASEYGLERSLIVDWDVHHGNGTQDIFYEDGRIHFFSIHRYPFYPGTGSEDETGTRDGLGATWNLPVPFGIPLTEYHDRFRRMLEDAAEKCRPQLVLISAGFDAHRDDPIGSLGLGEEDFTVMTQEVCNIAREYCEGKVVSVLEGGYHLDALAGSVQHHLKELLHHEAALKE